MARGDQLGRQWRIIQILITSKYGKSVSDIADELECNGRTVYRDLDALELAGFPIYTEKINGKNIWKILDDAKKQMPVPLNLTEVMALYFSRDVLKTMKNTLYFDSIQSLFKKIKSMLPEKFVNNLDKIEQSFTISQKSVKDYASLNDILQSINQAVFKNLVININYHTMSKDKHTFRKVAPYNVWFYDGTFYIIGFCYLRKDIRIFAVDRIKDLEVTDSIFSMPENFNAQDYMKSSFGVFKGEKTKVVIKFNKDIAGYIKETIWHKSQVISDLEDGSILFEAEVSGIDEIRYWVMKWGSKAEVLEPENLKTDIITELKKMISNYT